MSDRPTASIEYRQGDAPDAWRPLQVSRLEDGSVQLFVRFPLPHCDAAANRLRGAIVIAVLFSAVALWAHPALGAAVAGITLGLVYRAYARLLETCGLHRWVASPDGVRLERVSPRGYRRAHFLPRQRLGEVRALHAGGRWSVALGRRRYFAGLDETAIAAIAQSVRAGLSREDPAP